VENRRLTIRDKHGQVIATTNHPDQTAAHASLNHLAAEMHTRPEAKNCGVFDTAEDGWLWDTDTPEVCIAGTYKIEWTGK
jgi:hypothetical protein